MLKLSANAVPCSLTTDQKCYKNGQVKEWYIPQPSDAKPQRPPNYYCWLSARRDLHIEDTVVGGSVLQQLGWSSTSMLSQQNVDPPIVAKQNSPQWLPHGNPFQLITSNTRQPVQSNSKKLLNVSLLSLPFLSCFWCVVSEATALAKSFSIFQ